MRLAHFCTRFSRLSETFIYDLIVGLERSGVENHVLTAERVNAAERPFARVRTLPIPLWRQAVFAARKRCLGVYRLPLPAQAARRALREIRPDAILAHFGGAGVAIAPVARELGIPLAVVFHAFDLHMRRVRAATYADLWAGGASAVAISDHGRRRLIALGCPAERLRVIHCGVDASRFTSPRERAARAHGLHIASIGRLVEKKGFDDLIRATAALQARLAEPVRVDIWGEGPLKARLAGLARKLGVAAVVTFRGAARADVVPQVLRECDIFALASRTARDGDSEGIPVTILEAQAAGLPVVSTLHAGIPEAVPPANHLLLAPEGDAEDLARKLLWLATQRACWDEIGRRGREWVLTHFMLRDEIAAYRSLFDKIAVTSAPEQRYLPSPRRGAPEGARPAHDAAAADLSMGGVA